MYAILTPVPSHTNNGKGWSVQRWVDQHNYPHIINLNMTLQIARRARPPRRAPCKMNWRYWNLVSINHIVDSALLTDVLWFALLQMQLPSRPFHIPPTFSIFFLQSSQTLNFLNPHPQAQRLWAWWRLALPKRKGNWYDLLSLDTIWYLVNWWDLIPIERIKLFWTN